MRLVARRNLGAEGGSIEVVPPKRGGYAARIETGQSAGITPRDAATPLGEVTRFERMLRQTLFQRNLLLVGGRSRRQCLRHEDARGTGRVAGDAAEFVPTMTFVKARRLKADGKEHRRATAAPHPFFLGQPQHVAAKVVTAQFLRQKDQVEEEKAERGPSQYAAERLSARISHQYGEGPRIAVAHLLGVVVREAIADGAAGGIVRRIGQEQGGIGHFVEDF